MKQVRKCTKQSKAGGELGGERWCKAKKAKILQLQQADTQKGECAYAHVSIEQGCEVLEVGGCVKELQQSVTPSE